MNWLIVGLILGFYAKELLRATASISQKIQKAIPEKKPETPKAIYSDEDTIDAERQKQENILKQLNPDK